MEVDWNVVFQIFKEMLPSLYPLIGVTIALNLSLTIFRLMRRILGDSSCTSDTDNLEDIEYEEVVEDGEANLTGLEFVENDSVIKYY